MISDQDKQRIEEAAREYISQWNGGNSDHKIRKMKQFFKEDFISGAEYENPIAYNKGWDDAIDQLLKKFEEEGLTGVFYKELQKMRK